MVPVEIRNVARKGEPAENVCQRKRKRPPLFHKMEEYSMHGPKEPKKKNFSP
jgi:hypothetical protein